MVSPFGKTAGASLESESTAQLSEVAGSTRDTTASHTPGSVFTVTSAGVAMVGGSFSKVTTAESSTCEGVPPSATTVRSADQVVPSGSGPVEVLQLPVPVKSVNVMVAFRTPSL